MGINAGSSHPSRAVALCILAAVSLLWISFDQVVKYFVDHSGYMIGESLYHSYFGFLSFRLVHNTGAAWGIFSNATFILGIVSIFVSVLIALCSIVYVPYLNYVQCFALSLIAAGGFGNAIDRLTLGYVVDFIQFDFIDFPVFNIADMGVTLGFAILFVSLAVCRFSRHSKKSPSSGGLHKSKPPLSEDDLR